MWLESYALYVWGALLQNNYLMRLWSRLNCVNHIEAAEEAQLLYNWMIYPYSYPAALNELKLTGCVHEFKYIVFSFLMIYNLFSTVSYH